MNIYFPPLTGIISFVSLLPAFILALAKYRCKNTYKPFILLTLIGAATEVFSLAFRYQELPTMWLLNILIIVQYYLVIEQLVKWDFLNWRMHYVKVSVIVIGALWLTETYIKQNQSFNDYTLAISGFFLTIFFTAYLNKLIFEDIKFILKDSRFLISIGFLIYFTVSLVIFIFTNNALGLSADFFSNIWAIHNIINTFTNLIFALALLWMPTK